MSASEWIWTKIGFALLAALAASVWGLIFYPFISTINPDVHLATVLMVFEGLFIVISLINEKWIGKAGLGAIFALWGAVVGLFAEGGSAPSDFAWREYGFELSVCFGLGIASTLLLLW